MLSKQYDIRSDRHNVIVFSVPCIHYTTVSEKRGFRNPIHPRAYARWILKGKIKNKRIKYIDIVKAFGIIAVVAGHSFFPFPIPQFFSFFELPLFIFVSGYLYKDIYSFYPKLLFRKRIKSLYFPYIKYGLIFLFFHNIFFALNIYSNETTWYLFENSNHLYNIKEFIVNAIKIITFGETEPLVAPFWFIISLFITTLIFTIISYSLEKINISKEKKEAARIIIIIFVFIIALVLVFKKIDLPRRINSALLYLPYFYFGYLYNKFEEKIKLKTSAIFLFIPILFMGSIWTALLASGLLHINNAIFAAFYIFFAIMGIYVILVIAKILEKKFDTKIIEYIGKNTLTILALHYLSFKLVNLLIIILYSYPPEKLGEIPVITERTDWAPIYFLTGIFIPLLIIFILNGFKILLREKVKNILSSSRNSENDLLA